MNWLGGLGFLALLLALLPDSKASSINIMSAESSGIQSDKIVPKVGRSAKILYIIYIFFTVLVTILLMIGKMSPLDAIIHAFGTVSTGGFSTKNASVGAFGAFSRYVIAIFMWICGVNFSQYYALARGKWRDFLRSEETFFYLAATIISVALITWNIFGSVFINVSAAFEAAFFNVISIFSTAGFSTTDFGLWPPLSQFILMILMFFGGCAGSTSGGIKCVRVILLSKCAKREISRQLRPNVVRPIKLGGQFVDEKILRSIKVYFFIYVAIITIATTLVLFDGFDIITTLTAVLSSISNIGPGLGATSPSGSFAAFSPISKIIMSFCMIAGRLELFPILSLAKNDFSKT
jgi:trk system potassium uptake protein TrkH